MNRGRHLQTIGDRCRYRVAFAPSQQRPRNLTIDSGRGPAPAGEIDRCLVDDKIKMVARQHRRFANALHRQCLPSPQIESRDHAASHQSLNETPSSDSSRGSLATSARPRPTSVTDSFNRHQTTLQIAIRQLAASSNQTRAHAEFPPRQTRSDRTASPSFGGDRSMDQRIKEEAIESREKREPLTVANALPSSRGASVARRRDQKWLRERSRTEGPARDFPQASQC